MDNFNLYAEYYNLLYKDKDYLKETNYVEELFLRLNKDAKTILDLGCGTGRHDYEFFKKGYLVTGVDLSQNMLQLTQNLPLNKIEFLQGDIRYLELNRKFDVVISLFHVLSYQQTNSDVLLYFETVKKHLNPGGIFICDFWYGVGVLNDKPTVRKKVLENDVYKIIRIAEPEIHFEQNIVDVNYTMLINDKINNKFDEFNEQHKMRYFFSPEIKLFTENSNLKLIHEYKWLERVKPDRNTWYSIIVIKKIP